MTARVKSKGFGQGHLGQGQRYVFRDRIPAVKPEKRSRGRVCQDLNLAGQDLFGRDLAEQNKFSG
jgi:hypothetical protein